MKGPVLVVDDDDGVREVLEDTLELAGYDTMTASDGRDALAQLDERVPELVVLDVMMPHMDAYAFVTELEKRGLRKRVAILVLSASGFAQQHAVRMGADGFFDKPFDLDDLVTEVERLLQRLRTGGP